MTFQQVLQDNISGYYGVEDILQGEILQNALERIENKNTRYSISSEEEKEGINVPHLIQQVTCERAMLRYLHGGLQ